MTRLGDRYELRHLLGRGGLGDVWAARDLHSGRDVAVKTVDAARGVGDLLRHEAAATCAVDHPAVVEVHDAGHDGATAYLVMDLLPGADLAQVLRRGPVDVAEAVRIVGAVADALDAAHRAGVVHGDVKPANVVVGEDGVSLVDFGAAAPSEPSGAPLTFGTAPYMAPEQVRTRSVSPATDVYALGCLLHATLTGRPPFLGDSPLVVLRQHVRERPPRLAELLPGVPHELDELAAAMLAKDPADRRTAAQVRERLTLLQRQGALEGLTARPALASQGGDQQDPEATLPALVVLRGTGEGTDERLRPAA